MSAKAKIRRIHIPDGKRVICISDIHGEIDLFKRLLGMIDFCDDDVLILPGDIYTKGSHPHDTLKYCIKLDENPNVHILRGNADWGGDDVSQQENQWLDALPDIIESDEYIFVHSGLNAGALEEQPSAKSVKFNNFMETAGKFDKWVVVGHWPTAMYCHEIPCANPIINQEKKIISIDGGNVLKPDGQLNAFIISSGQFSFMSADNLPKHTAMKRQPESGGTLAITWLDRFVEIVEDGERLCRVRHNKTGKILTVPKSRIWVDDNENTCACDSATDYHLPCEIGDIVSVVEDFEDRMFAKLNGFSGWVIK
ncbi:MAG: metallophosphoesterase [Defluviitaleaceae bacterium]|nr:metallophosphoesterase [Defluviitaleaceae bacterium]